MAEGMREGQQWSWDHPILPGEHLILKVEETTCGFIPRRFLSIYDQVSNSSSSCGQEKLLSFIEFSLCTGFALSSSSCCPLGNKLNFMIMVLGLVIPDRLDWGPLYVKLKNWWPKQRISFGLWDLDWK